MLNVLAIITLCVGALEAQTQSSTSTVKISVTSHRNQTGHWISQVELVQDTDSNPNENKSKAWKINIQLGSMVCPNKEESPETTFLLTAPSTSALSTQKGIPRGYELFRGVGYYKFHYQPTTWPLALEVCAEEGGYLAVINSEKEADVMKTLMGRYPSIQAASNNDWAWIGLQRIGEHYFTIFGDALETTGFQRWSASEPQKGTQFCGLVGRAAGALADHLCDWKVAFVCEFDTD